MDIKDLLEQAVVCSKKATHEGYHLSARAAYAQVAAGLSAVARAMIEYERLQDERLEAEHRQMLAQREIDESPF
jgi:hypothetical protein